MKRGHRAIFTAYLAQLDTLVNGFNKQAYIGEACYGPLRTAAASNRALELARLERTQAQTALFEQVRAMNTQHEQDQNDYETLTDHGRTQTNHDEDASNTIIPPGTPLTLK